MNKHASDQGLPDLASLSETRLLAVAVSIVAVAVALTADIDRLSTLLLEAYTRTFGGETPDLQTQAAADRLYRPGWAQPFEWVLAVALAVSAIIVLPRGSTLRAVLWALAAAPSLFVASGLVFAQAHIFFDPILPALLAGSAALAIAVAPWLAAPRRLSEVQTRLDRAETQAAQVAGEMRAAAAVQRAMLPDRQALRALPPQVDLEVWLMQARDVGGDFYDAFLIDPGHLFFMIGDVTGKGLPAALFMGLSKAITRSATLSREAGLAHWIRQANRQVSGENAAEMFFTGIFGVLDLESGETQLCNAGHENPLILRRDGSCAEFAMTGGPPFCVLEDYDYPVEPVALAPGDLMVVATDGVSEACAPDGTMFGRGRVLDTLCALPRQATAATAVSALVEAVRGFQNGAAATDDLTVLALSYRGPPH